MMGILKRREDSLPTEEASPDWRGHKVIYWLPPSIHFICRADAPAARVSESMHRNKPRGSLHAGHYSSENEPKCSLKFVPNAPLHHHRPPPPNGIGQYFPVPSRGLT